MATSPMKHGLYMGRPGNYVGRPVDLKGRPMCCPVVKGAGAYTDVILLRLIVGDSLFFPAWIPWDTCFLAHERHITSTYTLLTQSCSTNDSVGWLPVDHHLLVLLQRPQQQQQQQQHVLPQHPVLLQYTLLQHPLSSKDNARTRSDILAAGSHATVAAPLIPGSTSTHMEVNVAATFGQKMSSVGLLHEVAPAVPSAGRTRARTSCCLRRRDGRECRLYTHNGAKALIRHLHKASYSITHPRRFARNGSYERTRYV